MKSLSELFTKGVYVRSLSDQLSMRMFIPVHRRVDRDVTEAVREQISSVGERLTIPHSVHWHTGGIFNQLMIQLFKDT